MPTFTVTTNPPMVRVAYAGTDFVANTHHITVYRVVDGVRTSVRSAIELYAVGGAVVEDYEAPIGVTYAYIAEQFNDAGVSLGYSTSSSTSIPAEAPNVAWISDPLDPATAVRVVLSDNAGSVRSRPVPGTIHRVGLRTVALVGQRGLLEDLPMDFYTESLADRDTLLATVGATGGLVLIRSAPPVPIPRLLYCWAADPRPREFDLLGSDEGAVWENTVQEISPIEGGIVSSLTSWQIYIDAFPLWSDFNAAYATWFDAMKNPPEV
jgi:hypothetical protein